MGPDIFPTRRPRMLREALLRSLAYVTRHVHPRGTDRLLRLVHSPDARDWWIDRITPLDGGLRLHASTKSFIEWRVFFYGTYEEHMSSLISAFVPPGGVAVDVGANVGVHTLAMWKAACAGSRRGIVIACEPNPGVLARLQSNLALNGAGEVVVYPVALLDREEAVELFVPGPQESNQGAATLGEGFPDVASPFRLDVAGTTLDLLLEREGIAGVDLIKVDVEGFEELVLAGSEKTLKRDHPNLVFEYSQEIWELSGHSLSRVLAMLRELGYGGVFHLGRRGSRALPNPPPSFTNIVVPRDGRMPRLTRSLR